MSTVLTVRLDEASQANFDQLRQRYFPPERNHIAAHITLFHTLPDTQRIEQVLADLSTPQSSFTLQVTGVRSLGKGVAYRLAATALQSLHAQLAQAFVDDLTPQDHQRLQPHVVVQNKVTPAAARDLLQQLEQRFTPWTVRAEGLDLWRYLGGPWEHKRTFWFEKNS